MTPGKIGSVWVEGASALILVAMIVSPACSSSSDGPGKCEGSPYDCMSQGDSNCTSVSGCQLISHLYASDTCDGIPDSCETIADTERCNAQGCH
jgi:hypothetical protein